MFLQFWYVRKKGDRTATQPLAATLAILPLCAPCRPLLSARPSSLHFEGGLGLHHAVIAKGSTIVAFEERHGKGNRRRRPSLWLPRPRSSWPGLRFFEASLPLTRCHFDALQLFPSKVCRVFYSTSASDLVIPSLILIVCHCESLAR